jgi:DNA-binding transcriptional MerR regulator
MRNDFSTGEAAEQLGKSEPELQDFIRRKKIVAPAKVRGRRRWTPAQIEKAREIIGRNR